MSRPYRCLACSTVLAPPFSWCPRCDGDRVADLDECLLCGDCYRCTRPDHAIRVAHFTCRCCAGEAGYVDLAEVRLAP